ncbi:MAG: DUF1800 domain-containing protein [Candidatus Eremiobacteraeota bacterium]|nr:DUF1800 domain-containing protein [Candidatus Eremiobacteraeota bacterium]
MAASTTAPVSYRPPGTLDAATALRPFAGSWTKRQAAHLLRRAGFGGSPADVDRLAAMGPDAAVASLIRFPDTSSLPARPDLPALPVPPIRPALMSPDQRREFVMTVNRTRREGLIALQTWWLQRMIATPAPLQEKMTLFWHGHFTSSPEKGTTPQELLMQNQLFREYALGNVRDLTLHVSQDPAMLRYLDNNVNVKAHPNENYARELMELFTLGIGNYTEQDIRESARAFTGWTFRRNFDGTGTFIDNAAQHDDGAKTFLGRTGNFSGADIVRIIFDQPAAPRFFATKLLSFFVYMDPEPALVDQVAALIARNGFALQPVMATLLRSDVFYSDRAYRALVKSPVEFVVGTHQLFGIPQVLPVELATLRAMGQVLFYPPNVKGWDGGSAWLNSATILTRENFANAVAQNPKMLATASWLTSAAQSMNPGAVTATLTQAMLQGDVSPASRSQLLAYLSGAGQSALPDLSMENAEERIRGAAYLTMAMPAYQLA